MLNENFVFQLLYASQAAPGVDAQCLNDIFSRSRLLNAEVGITGMLLMRHGYFLQLLEGREAAVRACYRRIIRDPRHTEVTLILQGPTDARLFPVWSMASVSQDTSYACFDQDLLPMLRELQTGSPCPEPRRSAIRQALSTFRHGLKTTA